ncbi:MAG: exosortase/archaeosortase family protein [Deltaproteobacteria bacterium]|nr:exosortase/archaeosortase family protein [Deltaproteobacteria bacterium]MBW2696410.1 exosortase/archaeosortase family protein [Deltaproteobacteria bacterium]
MSVAFVLAAFAYRALLSTELRVPEGSDVGQWIYAPEAKAPLLVLVIAGWLLWRRRERLFTPLRRPAWIPGLLLWALGSGLFVWAQLTRSNDLLLASLALSLFALTATSRGLSGCRVIMLPALVILLAAQIPATIQAELIWQLQLATANGVALLLPLVSDESVRQGVLLVIEDRSFLVIESCSGLRGIEILVLAAIVTRELFASSGRRQWLLVGVASLLGFGLNLIRVVLIVTSTDPEVAREHSAHGVFVLGVGTIILYSLGYWMASGRAADGTSPLRTTSGDPRVGDSGPWMVAAAWFAVLAIVSVAVPPFPGTDELRWTTLEIPESRADWQGERLKNDPMFHGSLFTGPHIYRRYSKDLETRWPQIVDLFVGLEIAGYEPSSRLFTSRIALPRRDWEVEEIRPAQVWVLDTPAELAIVSHGDDLLMLYLWRVRDDGFFAETLRDLFALEASPLRRDPPRGLVRVATPLPRDAPIARDRAKQTLDRFIADFRSEFEDL